MSTGLEVLNSPKHLRPGYLSATLAPFETPLVSDPVLADILSSAEQVLHRWEH